MAYLKRIKVVCDYHGCVSKASVELFSTTNHSIGNYCVKHGKIRLELQNKIELGY